MISIANLTHTSLNTPQNLPLYKNATYKFDLSYNSTMEMSSNNTFDVSNISHYAEYAEIPYYIKATSMTFCIVIMCLGVIGNVMVPIVILKTKDMRNSTNIFLVNLSIADLMVLLVCTPTVLVEVNSKPETWVLGKELCLAVPFVELTVAHASVLTILAISFERYYAICEPLRAGYVCTKTRATLICGLAWFFAALFTSPILAIAEHHTFTRQDGSTSSECLTQAVTFWQIFFFIMVIVLLYALPLVILIILYSVIAKNLITAASKVVMNKTVDPYNTRARKQVILMLGTVVLCFFLCLMPYRILALWIIITPQEIMQEISPERYYNLLYFSRIMLYINSAINPILYNLMSSKFRIGFCKVCFCYQRSTEGIKIRRTQVINGSTTSSSLTRTTNSLKKLFTQRGSLDKSEVELESKESVERTFFERIFSNKRFIRQQSAPVCTNVKPKINRMCSEGNVYDISDLDKNTKEDTIRFIDHSSNTNLTKIDEGSYSNNSKNLDENVSYSNSSRRIEERNHKSLRRSVLINSAKTKNVETRKKVTYQKIRVENLTPNNDECDLPESFV